MTKPAQPIYRLFTSRYGLGDLIPKIEEVHAGSQFVEEISCPTRGGGWSSAPALVFFQEKPPKPEFSNWFAYNLQPRYDDDKHYLVCTGLRTFDPIVTALFDETPEGGVITISRYGHDFVRSPVSENCIDGGREYTRLLGTNPVTVKFNLLDKSFVWKRRTRYAVRWQEVNLSEKL